MSVLSTKVHYGFTVHESKRFRFGHRGKRGEGAKNSRGTGLLRLQVAEPNLLDTSRTKRFVCDIVTVTRVVKATNIDRDMEFYFTRAASS